MRVCEECALQNPDGRDFCAQCGSYLRWELTGELPPMDVVGAGPGEAGPRTIVQTVRAEQVSVTLRVPGTELGPADGAEVTVAAGGEVTLVATVHNRHETVKRFEVRVEGLPDDAWWSVTPRTVHLLPPSSVDGCDAEVEIRLHPPRTATAEARRWPFWVEAAPAGAAGPSGRSPMAGLTIDPFDDCVASLEPSRRASRRAARFSLRLRNEGNTTAVVVPAVRDDAGECRARCEPAQVSLAPGEQAAVRVTVRRLRPLLIGRPVDRRIQVDGRIDGKRPLPPLAATYRQRAWLPRWLLVLVPVLLALALVASMRAPDATVAPDATPVPEVPGRTNEAPPPAAPPTPAPAATSPAATAAPPAAGRFAWAGLDGVVVLDAAGERTLGGTSGARQPSWSADGTMLAFVRAQGEHGRIWSIRPGDAADAPVALSDARGDYQRPEFSPDGSALAFIDAETGGLCVAIASGASDATQCLQDPTWRFTDVTWGPTGHALALAATPREPGGPAGVVEYLADGDPAIESSWRPVPSNGGLVLELPAVAQVAWSASAQQLAVLDAAPGRVHLLPTSSDAVTTPGEPVPALTACSVAWNPDGRLAVAETCERGAAPLALVDVRSGERRELGHGSDPAPAPRPRAA